MIDRIKWSIEPSSLLSGEQTFYLQSLSTNTGINSDSTATAVYAIDNNYHRSTDSALSLYSVGQEIEFFLGVINYEASQLVQRSIFKGTVDGLSYTNDTLTLTLTTNMNAAIKAGDVYEYNDYVNQEFGFLFDQNQLKALNPRARRSKYFDVACEINQVAYYCTHNDTFERVPIADPWPLFNESSANSLTKNDVLNYSLRLPTSVATTKPNVYDIGLTLFFTRHQYFVKTFNFDESDAEYPSDINSIVQVDIGDGNMESVYKAKALPAKKSAILAAIKSAGYTVMNVSNVVYSPDIYDFDGVALIYEADPTDDITRMTVTAFKYIPREVSVYYWKRILDQQSVNENGVIYKKVDRTFKITSTNPRSNPDFYPLESMFVDIYQPFDTAFNDAFKHAQYEMRSSANTNSIGSCQVIFDTSVSQLWADGHFVIGSAIPFKAFPVSTERMSSITGVSYNFNASSGEATISLNCGNDTLKPLPYGTGPNHVIPANPRRPDFVSYNASPYDQIGGGFINNLGSGSINDQDSWGMEETADIEHKVAGYLNPEDLTSTDPEEELTNIYIHDLYINSNFIDDVPYSRMSEQAKLRNDPVKRAYSEPINLFDQEFTSGGGGAF